MARFKLKDGVTVKQLGALVLAIAKGDQDQKSLMDLIDLQPGQTIEIVRDTENKIHIIIPYLGKKDSGETPEESLANEAEGQIVIFGCGQ